MIIVPKAVLGHLPMLATAMFLIYDILCRLYTKEQVFAIG